jgi:hypothetical protein
MGNASPGSDLYHYAYPMLLMDVTRQWLSPEGLQAPGGWFVHARAFPDDTCTSVIFPNSDTLSSIAFVDLDDEPVVLSLPNAHGRYIAFSIRDAWSNIVAAPEGSVPSASAEPVAIVGPDWQGTLPLGLVRIDAPTNDVWIAGRIQTNGGDDYPFVHTLQDRIELALLSAWKSGDFPVLHAPVDLPGDPAIAPIDRLAKMPAEQYWTRFSELLKRNPPAVFDAPIVARLNTCGIVPGRSLDWMELSPEQRERLVVATLDGLTEVEELGAIPPFEVENTWAVAYDLGKYGANYGLRAAAARLGLGANVARDGIEFIGRVDHEGELLTGRHAYVMHFDYDELPQVEAFWSLTMYSERRFFASNPIDRFAIGDRDPLVYDEDGSLDLYIQNDHPGSDRGANWLPAPAGSFSLILRLYRPDRSVLGERWVPPRVTRIG